MPLLHKNAERNVKTIMSSITPTAMARFGSIILFNCLIGPRRNPVAHSETIVPIEYNAPNP